MFDVTLTDKEFKKDFINQQSDWMQLTRGLEPDLAVDGLHQSVLSKLLGALGLA